MSKMKWAMVIVLGLLVTLFVANLVGMYAGRYFHFKAMTKQTLIDGAETYVRERTRDRGQHVCLYVVTCDTGTARLERVDNIQNLNMDQLKATIWKRRIDESYCQGRTTNIGLHLVPQKGHATEIEANAHARWSFYNDRFIPQLGRFQSGSFSDAPWQACTPEASLNTQLRGLSSGLPGK